VTKKKGCVYLPSLTPETAPEALVIFFLTKREKRKEKRENGFSSCGKQKIRTIFRVSRIKSFSFK